MAARAERRLLDAPGSFTLAQAYAVQGEVTRLRVGRGERIVGWKLGYTSAAMRAQMGVDAPNLGPLTDAMLLDTGTTLPAAALQPRVEPEIGLQLDAAVPPGASVGDVLARCARAVACLEVVDSIWSGYRFTLEDNTADGSSAAWVVVGPELPLDDLAAIDVALSVDGVEVASGSGADAGGHPAAGVAWLAGQLAEHPRGLRAGDLIITGGLTSAHPLRPNGRIAAAFAGGAASVEVRRGGAVRSASPPPAAR